MLRQLFAPQLVGLYILVASTLYVHFRGKERLRFAHQLGDHSTYLAPYNVLMYAGSAIPNQPVIPVESFPELKKLGEKSFARRRRVCSMKASSAPPPRTTTGVSIRSSRAAGSAFT